MEQFSFRSIQAGLQRETRHLEIKLGEHFDARGIFELESILAWAASKVEINTILLAPEGHSIPSSLQGLEDCSPEQAKDLLKRLRKIVVGMFYLPQTVVMDLGDGCRDLGAELALGADVRIASQGAQLQWNHLQLGRAPCSGGCSILPLIVGEARARKWLLLGEGRGGVRACGIWPPRLALPPGRGGEDIFTGHMPPVAGGPHPN